MLTQLGLAAALVFVLGAKKKKQTPGGATVQWDLRNAGNDGTSVFFDVFAPANSFGPHQELYIMRISARGNEPYQFVSADPSNARTAPQILARAIRDLSVQGAELATQQ